METDDVQTIATFTGKLLQRQRMARQPLVQLVFREAEQDWLCISSNLEHAKLHIGKEYRIEGLFKKLGEREYIHEPQIVPLTQRRLHPTRLALSTAIVLLVAGMTAFGVHAIHGNLAPTSADTGSPQKTAAVSATTTPATVASPTADATAAPATAPTTTAKPKTTTRTTTPSSTAPVVTVPVTTPTTLDCDPAVTTPFGFQTIVDDTQAVGYSAITTAGVDGLQQTCYPNGRSAAGVTTTSTVEQDQITTVGPTAAPVGP